VGSGGVWHSVDDLRILRDSIFEFVNVCLAQGTIGVMFQPAGETAEVEVCVYSTVNTIVTVPHCIVLEM
jgi:hypothetical protein